MTETGASCHKGCISVGSRQKANYRANAQRIFVHLHYLSVSLSRNNVVCIYVNRKNTVNDVYCSLLTGNIPSPSSMATIQSYKPIINDFGPPSLGFPQVGLMVIITLLHIIITY